MVINIIYLLFFVYLENYLFIIFIVEMDGNDLLNLFLLLNMKKLFRLLLF